MVLSLPIPRGPGASPLHCLPSCFCVSLCHFCSCFFLPRPPCSLSLYLFNFFLLFLLSLATHGLFCGFGLEDLSGAISPLVNKCCDRRQVEKMLEPDERGETPWNSSGSSVPGLIFLCGCVCLCVCACMSMCVCLTGCATVK